jgi:hypothetical protein
MAISTITLRTIKRRRNTSTALLDRVRAFGGKGRILGTVIGRCLLTCRSESRAQSSTTQTLSVSGFTRHDDNRDSQTVMDWRTSTPRMVVAVERGSGGTADAIVDRSLMRPTVVPIAVSRDQTRAEPRWRESLSSDGVRALRRRRDDYDHKQYQITNIRSHRFYFGSRALSCRSRSSYHE